VGPLQWQMGTFQVSPPWFNPL